MYIPPTLIPKRAREDWIFEIDCWLIIFDSWSLSGVLDKMVFTLKGSSETRDLEARGLTWRKISKGKRERERCRKMANGGIWRLVKSGCLVY